jgi:hypothetical protein
MQITRMIKVVGNILLCICMSAQVSMMVLTYYLKAAHSHIRPGDDIYARLSGVWEIPVTLRNLIIPFPTR